MNERNPTQSLTEGITKMEILWKGKGMQWGRSQSTKRDGDVNQHRAKRMKHSQWCNIKAVLNICSNFQLVVQVNQALVIQVTLKDLNLKNFLINHSHIATHAAPHTQNYTPHCTATASNAIVAVVAIMVIIMQTQSEYEMTL